MKRWLERAQVSVPLIWAGLVLGLSFIETPLKFRAPGVTRELGLSIGRLVFGTLGRIELALAIVLLAIWMPAAGQLVTRLALTWVVGVVAAQAGWLLPRLDAQAAALIAGAPAADTYHHVLFVVLEASKLVVLVGLALHHAAFAARPAPVPQRPSLPSFAGPPRLPRGEP